MNNQILKWVGSVVILSGLTMLFTQCESNDTEIAQLDAMKLAASADSRAITVGEGDNATSICDCLLNSYEFESLSSTETDALLFMREEEKLARDVYLALYEKWNAKVFSNIAKAEQSHMDAVLCIINKYELTDPVGDNANGVFQNTDLQALYTSFTDQGEQSLEAAFLVGATIEDLDISDLLLRMQDMDNEDILAVFTELTKGSRNHLRAFNRNLVRIDVTYEPQNISPELFAEIISTPVERGGSICGICLGGGNGNGGNGPGNGTGICDGTGPNGNGGNGPGNCTGPCDGTGPNGTGGGGNGPGTGTGTCDGTGSNGSGGNNGGGNGGDNGNGGGN